MVIGPGRGRFSPRLSLLNLVGPPAFHGPLAVRTGEVTTGLPVHRAALRHGTKS